jgi:hypothetical protein
MVISTVGLLGIATVDDGEVIPVTNNPPHPPPLPEPPPFIIGFDYRIHRWLHSSTSTDGEKKLLFRLMYQVHDDDDDDDITATTAAATTTTTTTTDGELLL